MGKNEELKTAINVVNKTIEEEREHLIELTDSEEESPVMVEGETETGHYCQIMADPKNIAKIFLDYDYPVWDVLELDASDEMWRELGRLFGLKTVCAVDL